LSKADTKRRGPGLRARPTPFADGSEFSESVEVAFAPARIRIISPTPNEVTGPDVNVRVSAVLFTVK
jgi:hypothetical protein